MKRKAKRKTEVKNLSRNNGKHPGGRPTKFTPERRQKILEAIRTGASLKAVAHYGRISYDCLRDWIVKGSETTREGDEYFQFFQDVNEALGTLQVRSLASIQKTGLGGVVLSEKTISKKNGDQEIIKTYSQPQWMALTWIMQHRFREEWGDEIEPGSMETPRQLKPLMTLKRETIDIYAPDRLARLISAFGEAKLIPEEILIRLPGQSSA